MTSTEIINFMSTELEDNGEMSRWEQNNCEGVTTTFWRFLCHSQISADASVSGSGSYHNDHDCRDFWQLADHHRTDPMSEGQECRSRFHYEVNKVAKLSFNWWTQLTAINFSLCAADCLFCLLVLPFMALRYIQGGWSHGEGFLCTFVPFIQYGNVGVSLLCIGMITINRWELADSSKFERN